MFMIYRKTQCLKYLYANILFCVFLFSSTAIHAEINITQKGCAVQAKQLKNNKDILFVDVRRKSDFERKSIPGSINIPLTLIDTKAFLRNKNIILVGHGWNERVLDQKCVDLKTKNFKSVKVLSGGIVSWFKNENKVMLKKLVSLSAVDFFNNSDQKFVAFVISDKNKKTINAVLPHAKVYPAKVHKKKLLNAMKKLGQGDNPLVMFSDESVAVVDAAISAYLNSSLRKVFYYEAGFESYKKMNKLNKITAMSNQRQRLTTKKPVSCAF